ncbi:MAG TPA: hypothetical protein VFZ73_07575 [Gemmatimonadaceae bacterium]
MTTFVRAACFAVALSLTALKDGEAQSPFPAAGAESRSTDTVRVGCSGGDTGGGGGNTLTRDGHRATYEHPTWRRDSITHSPLRRDPAAATTVFAALEGVRFRALRFNKVGNMTCVLALHDGEGGHAVTWLMGHPPQELAPVLAALKRAFGDDRRLWP